MKLTRANIRIRKKSWRFLLLFIIVFYCPVVATAVRSRFQLYHNCNKYRFAHRFTFGIFTVVSDKLKRSEEK